MSFRTEVWKLCICNDCGKRFMIREEAENICPQCSSKNVKVYDVERKG